MNTAPGHSVLAGHAFPQRRPPRAVTWGPFHRPRLWPANAHQPGRRRRIHPPGRTLPAGLGVWSRHRASVPTAPWAWLHQHFLWTRVGSHVSALWLPHGPRHPAGDPERCLPHPCPQTCVHSYARLSFWKEVCGLGLNPGSSSRWLCTSH